MKVRIPNEVERVRAADVLRREWGEPVMVRGRIYRFDDCQILVAGEMTGIAAVSHDEWPVMELVAINAFAQWQGVGSALVESIVASATAAGFEAIRLTTTNDNLDALRFYQRRGFRLTALRPGAVDEARRLKPGISVSGKHGIPIRDELDLIRTLR